MSRRHCTELFILSAIGRDKNKFYASSAVSGAGLAMA